MRNVCFTDLETTGLDPWPAHEPWEVGLVLPETPGTPRVEIVWQLPVNILRAHPRALEVGRFSERRWTLADTDVERKNAVTGVDVTDGATHPGHVVHPDDMHFWAAEYGRLTRGRALAGANVGFDMKDHLNALLRRHGGDPGYHWRPVCTEALLYGYLARTVAADPDLTGDLPEGCLDIPWRHEQLLAALRVVHPTLDLDLASRHTAIGDCRLAERVLAVVTGAWTP